MKNQRLGFTLVELMIVVAIIGILAAIAVPNYQKYQAKARQAEVKLNLAAAHTALTAFTTENSSYTSCLGSIGVGTATGRQYYTFGFEPGPAAAGGCGPTSASPCNAYAWSAGGVAAASCDPAIAPPAVPVVYFPASAAVAGGAITTIASFNAGGGAAAVTSISASAFVLGAAGSISNTTGVTPDRWTMDQAKTLINVNSGL